MRTLNPNHPLEPAVFVISGGAGDVTWRRLVPALFDLSQDRSLPTKLSVIAVDRVELSDDILRRQFHAGVKEFARHSTVEGGASYEFATRFVRKAAVYVQRWSTNHCAASIVPQ